MRTDWSPLRDELARWRAAGLTLPLWWRDDDAVAPTPALARLAALAGRLGLPVHLAVIPAPAGPALAGAVADDPRLIPLVHGWAHVSHAPAGERKAEFGPHRPAAAMLAETARGLARLGELFGPRLRPVFVPPWNRIDTALLPGLAGQGYAAISAFTPRSRPEAAPGLAQINTHLDPVDWRGTRGLAAPERLIADLVRRLAERRAGRADNAEPFGILTHHLVHDAEIWTFTEELLSRLLEGGARPWTFAAGDEDEEGKTTT